MQMIFQDPFGSLNPRRTVADTLRQTIRIHGLAQSKAEESSIILKTLEEVGLKPVDEFWDKYPALLSGGQLQRVSIGRVLVLQPRLVIADEPVSMLDVSVRIGILELLATMRDRFGISFVYITHDLVTARYICDRIAIMYLGKIVEIGETESDTMEGVYMGCPNPGIARASQIPVALIICDHQNHIGVAFTACCVCHSCAPFIEWFYPTLRILGHARFKTRCVSI